MIEGGYEKERRYSCCILLFYGLSYRHKIFKTVALIDIMDDTLKLAIVGIGLMGKRHAKAISQSEGVDLVAIVEPGAEGEIFASQQALPCFSCLKDMFSVVKPDGVILATPTALHVVQALDCIAHNCPVLIEKPLATCVNEAIEIVVAARNARIPVLVGHHRRYNPLVQKAYDTIREGHIGAVRAVHAQCWFYKPDHYFDCAPWRTQKGAGPISVNLVHDIDLIRYLCGGVISVQAEATPSRRGHENEDLAAALLTFVNGAVGTLTVSDAVVSPWSWELTAQEYPIYPPTGQSCYFIGGDRGSLSVPDLRVWHNQGERDWWEPMSATSLLRETSDPLVNQILHFARVIRGEVKPLVSALEGLKTLQVIEAIQVAAYRKQRVVIEATESLLEPGA